MNGYKIGFENGESFTTGFNGNLDEAKAYYLGKVFNLGIVMDDLQKCNSVEPVQVVNSMCEKCLRLFKDCEGTRSQVWTGCIYRRTEGER